MSLSVYRWDGGAARLVHGTGPSVVIPDIPNDPSSALWGAGEIGSATFPVPSTGAVYVAPTGDDTTGTGSAGAPYASLRKAAASAPADSTIVMREGTYHEGVTSENLASRITFANANVTVQNYPGEAVWLDGSQVVTGWASYDTNKYRAAFETRIDRAWTQTRGADGSGLADGYDFVGTMNPIGHWNEQVFLDGVQLTQVKTLAEVGPGKFFVQGAPAASSGTWRNLFVSTHYVIGDNPAGKEVRVSRLAQCLGAIGGARNGIRLRGLGFRRYANSMPDWGCLYLEGSGNVIENCIFEDHSDLAIHGANNPGLVVRNSTFRRIGRKGIGGNYLHDGIIEWNLFEKTNYSRFNYSPDGGAVKVAYSDRLHVRWNWFNDNYGPGIWYDAWCSQTKTYGNMLIGTHGMGVFVEISKSCQVVDNIFIDNGIASKSPHANPAITIGESDDCDVWHNTIIGAEQGIHIADGKRTGGQRGIEAVINSGRVCNNVVANAAGINQVQSAFLTFYDENNVKGTEDFGIVLRGNLYARPDATHPARLAMGWLAGGGVSVYFNLTGTPYPSTAPSWVVTTGDTSTFSASGDVVQAKALGRIRSSAMTNVSRATVPAHVAALMVGSPFIAQPVGAGHL